VIRRNLLSASLRAFAGKFANYRPRPVLSLRDALRGVESFKEGRGLSPPRKFLCLFFVWKWYILQHFDA